MLQPGEVARSGGAKRDARHEPLEVMDRLQKFAKLSTGRAAKGQLLHRVEPVANPLQGDERPQQPRPQQPPAHRGDGAIDLVQQRAIPMAFHRFDHLEMPERDGIDEQAVGGCFERHGAHVRQIRPLRVAQIVEQRARGRHRRRVRIQAEPFETARL